MTTNSNQNWYREPWAWFTLIMFVSAIAVACTMCVIAINHAPAEIGSHRFNEGVLAKRERMQTSLLKVIALKANLHISPAGELSVTLEHNNRKIKAEDRLRIAPNELQLYVEHPIDPALDQKIILKRDDHQIYHGRLITHISGKQYLMLSPKDDSWYLTYKSFISLPTNIILTPGVT